MQPVTGNFTGYRLSFYNLNWGFRCFAAFVRGTASLILGLCVIIYNKTNSVCVVCQSFEIHGRNSVYTVQLEVHEYKTQAAVLWNRAEFRPRTICGISDAEKKLAEFSIVCSVTKVVVCYLLNKRMATFTIVPYCQQIAKHSAPVIPQSIFGCVEISDAVHLDPFGRNLSMSLRKV